MSDNLRSEMMRAQNEYLKMERERASWLKTLEHNREENVFMKNCLAIIIRDSSDAKMLEQAEYYQNLFVNKDVTISLLKYDIAAQTGLANQENEITGHISRMLKKQCKLRTDMLKMDIEFRRLDMLFNDYMQNIM